MLSAVMIASEDGERNASLPKPTMVTPTSSRMRLSARVLPTSGVPAAIASATTEGAKCAYIVSLSVGTDHPARQRGAEEFAELHDRGCCRRGS